MGHDHGGKSENEQETYTRDGLVERSGCIWDFWNGIYDCLAIAKDFGGEKEQWENSEMHLEREFWACVYDESESGNDEDRFQKILYDLYVYVYPHYISQIG